MRDSGFRPIEDYFVVGDLRTAALVSAAGSVDWLCLPYFDSPSIFGKLLDPSAGGFCIDMPDYKISSHYLDGTAMVEFDLSNERQQVTVTDFMVPKPTKSQVNQQLVRAISGVRGQSEVRFTLQPRGDYGTSTPSIQIDEGGLSFPVGSGTVNLYLPPTAKVARRAGGEYCQISIPITVGEYKQLVLEYVPEGNKPSTGNSDLSGKTAKFWQEWVAKGQYVDFCRDYLVRSAITLKLMQFYPTGALVAAPTTSLPEEIGGVRNWDYRFSWIRDATFTLYAFYVLGYDDEAEHYFDFIAEITERCSGEDFDVSLMYTIWGEPAPPERSFESLSGYKGSRPVRVGNDATRQFQLDVYGALIDAFYFATKHGLTDVHRARRRRLVSQLVRKIDELWKQPDHGIWEARNSPKHYTYSKVMAWVGVDRAMRLEEPLGLSDADLQICHNLAETIGNWVWQNGYEAELENLAQHPGSRVIDATNLLLVLLQFLDKHDPLTKRIISRTAEQLSYQKVFVYRYLGPDGLAGKEGAFMLCSFWLVSALAIIEEVESAIDLFRQLEQYMKPHGLLSEEIDPVSNAYLGNYPQAFSHQGYIISAYYIDKYAKRKNIKL